MTTTAPDLDTAADTAAAVLAFARDRRAAADAAEADLLHAAVAWADLHPAESIHDAALLSRHGDQPLPVAGPGAPLVAEFCVAEFAAAVGLPTETGKAYLGEALELRHRLPKTWARVQSGDLPAWRARRIARATIALSPAAAGFVDDQVAPFAHRIRPTGVDRLVEEAIVRFMPDRGPASPGGRRGRPARARAHPPGVLRGHRVGRGRGRPRRRPGPRHRPLGRCRPAGRPRLHRLAGRAPLRSARADGPAPARPGPRHPTDTETAGPAPGRQVVLHVHLSEDAITGTRPSPRSCTWPGWRTPARFVDADQVRAWCGVPGTTVTVKPVIDLTEHLHVDQYQVPDRLAAQAAERDLTCVFPWCTRPAEACDIDHVIPYSEGGPTASDNLGSALPPAPPAQDPPLRLGLHRPRTRLLPVVLTARLPVPARPPRHHRRHPRPDIAPARPVATPPHTPRQHDPARGHRHVPGRMSARHHLPHPSLRARESAAAGRHPVTAAGGERKRVAWRRRNAQPQRRPPPTRHPPATAGGGRRGPSGASPRAPDA